MKYHLLIPALIFLVSACGLIPPQLVEPTHRIVIEMESIDGSYFKADMMQTGAYLSDYAKALDLGIHSVETDTQGRKITLLLHRLPKDSKSEFQDITHAAQTLCQSAQLGFWDTYRATDPEMSVFMSNLEKAVAARTQANDLTIRNILITDPQQANQESIIQAAFIDRPHANQLIASIKGLPEDAVLMWSALPQSYPENSTFYDLFVLRKTTQEGPYITGKDIANASADLDQYSKTAAISIEMYERPARIWANKTRASANNGQRAVAIVIDDLVLSAPRVVSEISGGRSVITGGFTLLEAQLLAQQIKMGSLPYRLKVLEATKL